VAVSHSAPAPAGATSGAPSRGTRLAGSPLLRGWGISLVLALITLAWPTIPSYDPFSWVVWGREVSDPHISFFVGGGPSWKPLPFLFTTVYGLFGSVAPALWVITERVGALAGLIAAWRLTDLLCRRAGLPRWLGWVCGVISAAAVVLTIDWSYYFFRGASEPVLIACALWAVDRALARRHGQAWFLLCCEGLMRPEAWPFLLLYGAWLFWRAPSMRAWVVIGLVAQPVGWFVPPWISTGQPFLAATHASEYNGHLGADPFATVMGRGESLQPLPALGSAVVGVLLALVLGWRGAADGLRTAWRTRGRSGLERIPLEVWLAGAVIAWWVVVVGMTLDGYPGLQRFFLPAAGLTCVLGGVGLARVAWLLGGLAGRLLRALPAAAGAVAAIVVVVGLVGSWHYASPRVRFLRAQEPLAATAVQRIDQLGRAVRVLGGKSAILPCGSSVVTINHSMQTAFAWQLGTTLERVQTVLFAPGIAFVGPWDSIDGGPPPIAFKYRARLLRRVGAWRIYQVARAGQPLGRCVGS
jgi:hypothetical protein